MNVGYSKKFLKQLAVMPSGVRAKIESFVFDELPRLDSFAESGKVEKMSGYRGCYKVRFGSYRVGLQKEQEKVVVKLVMHRREIYRYFP